MQTTRSALRVAESAPPGALWLSSLQLCSADLMLVRRVEASCFSLPLLRGSSQLGKETRLSATALCSSDRVVHISKGQGSVSPLAEFGQAMAHVCQLVASGSFLYLDNQHRHPQ